MAGELLSVPLFSQDAVMSPPDEALLAHLDGCTGGSLWGGTSGEVHTAHTVTVEVPNTL